ncbi:protein of unknown function [Vibrio tapetis subsp. tapetis]|uniref:Uncharacterized protein n=1 Tax=Vibrio tapetis subsp. tapetis TaxID=1671868 RepID=A0A2N8ZNC4_9VIBR|nr:protein of unknown function [Vibrio tapetis subsp. tapetis]
MAFHKYYERWAVGGIGLSIVGEVQAELRFHEKPGNLVLSERSSIKGLQMLTSPASINYANTP